MCISVKTLIRYKVNAVTGSVTSVQCEKAPAGGALLQQLHTALWQRHLRKQNVTLIQTPDVFIPFTLWEALTTSSCRRTKYSSYSLIFTGVWWCFVWDLSTFEDLWESFCRSPPDWLIPWAVLLMCHLLIGSCEHFKNTGSCSASSQWIWTDSDTRAPQSLIL